MKNLMQVSRVEAASGDQKGGERLRSGTCMSILVMRVTIVWQGKILREVKKSLLVGVLVTQVLAVASMEFHRLMFWL